MYTYLQSSTQCGYLHIISIWIPTKVAVQISPFVNFILLLAWSIRKGSGVVPIAMKTTNPPFWIVHMIYALTLLSICSYIAKRENQLLWPYLTLLCNWWWCIGKKYQQFGRIGYICYVLCISQKARSFNSIHSISFLYELKYSEHFISYQYMLANAVCKCRIESIYY